LSLVAAGLGAIAIFLPQHPLASLLADAEVGGVPLENVAGAESWCAGCCLLAIDHSGETILWV